MLILGQIQYQNHSWSFFMKTLIRISEKQGTGKSHHWYLWGPNWVFNIWCQPYILYLLLQHPYKMKNAFCKFQTSKALHIVQVHRANKLDSPCWLLSLVCSAACPPLNTVSPAPKISSKLGLRYDDFELIEEHPIGTIKWAATYNRIIDL